ncbi:hypothetical protein [Methanobrevibacter sp.]|uniref:phage tail protein n=1 Tax=Methanobrevibacter sp. TaxID=66852 RepID=UPI00388E5041
MADTMEIIISAVDSASEVFQSIISSAQGMADGVSDAIEGAGSDFDTIAENVDSFSDSVANVDSSTLEALADTLGMDTEEVERLIASGADMGTLSAGFNEVASAADELETEIQEDIDAMEQLGSAGDVMAAQTFMDVANGMKDSMLGMADTAGTFNDSLMRAGLEAQGAGHSVEDMKNMVSELSETTGRAGGQIRESFITATARGITDMDSFQKMMEGAGAQATLFGTDIQSMANSFSGLAAKATISEKFIANMGITMDELGQAMGLTGATADEVKAKWKELDTNQRAAALGMAASMNEGKNANEEYKTSWAGLQEQVNIARGRLERLVGSVILPTLIPAMQLAGTILSGVGDVIQGVMGGPLGGLVSLLGSLGGAFLIGVSGAAALRNILGFLKLEAMFASIETTALTVAEVLQGETSIASAAANIIGASGFAGLATAAWGAATAVWAAMVPLLPFIAAAAAVAIAIFEVGKAFGWWTDVSSMIDAISAGLQRLWNAFINHPDVQAVISAISNAWNSLMSAIQGAGQAIMEFFGISTGGDFDIVSALIHAIGDAWNAIREPIMAVIEMYTTFTSSLYALVTGQMDLQTAVMNIWNSLATNMPVILQFIYTYLLSFVAQMAVYAIQAGLSFVNGIISYISQIPGRVSTYLTQTLTRIISIGARWVAQARAKASQLLNGVVSFLRQLPGRALSALLGVVSSIVSAGAQWISNARSRATSVVTGVVNILTGLPGKISSALSGVASAITGPFKQAYDSVVDVVDSIKSKVQDGINAIGNLNNARGGETFAMGGETSVDFGEFSSVESSNAKTEIDINHNIVLDLINVPAHIETAALIEMLKDPAVLNSFVSNPDFQSLDAKVKSTIQSRYNRSRGV